MQSTGSTWKSSRLISCSAQPSIALRHVSSVMMNGRAECGYPGLCRTASMPIPYRDKHGRDRRDNPGPVFHNEAQIIRRGEFSAHVLRRLHFMAGRRMTPRRCARSNTDRKPRRRPSDRRPLRSRKTPFAPHIAPWPSPDSCCPPRAPPAKKPEPARAAQTRARSIHLPFLSWPAKSGESCSSIRARRQNPRPRPRKSASTESVRFARGRAIRLASESPAWRARRILPRHSSDRLRRSPVPAPLFSADSKLAPVASIFVRIKLQVPFSTPAILKSRSPARPS